MKNNKKICIVSSCGGHLTEIRRLLSIYSSYDHLYVLNDKALLPTDMEKNTYFISHSERDWKFFKNLWEAFNVLRIERPAILLSTGAGPIVPFTMVGKFLFGIKTIYVETITSVERPSLTGKIMYYLADFFFYQWPTLKAYFPKGEYVGTLL